MKKVFILLVMILVVTGCTAEYNLTFEDGVFSENIVITEEKVDEGLGYFGIMQLQDNPKLAQLDDRYSYDYQFSTNEKYNILTLNFKYDKIPLEKSLVYQDCFRYRDFIDGANYYYVKLEGDMSCEYLSNATITFKTDKKVFMDNADEKDEEKGIYKWNNFKGGTIYFQVSKNISIEKAMADKNKGELIPWYIKIIIALITVGIVFIFFSKLKREQL